MLLQRSSIRYGMRVVCEIVLLLLLGSPISASPLQQGCATMGFSRTNAWGTQVGDVVVLQVPLDTDGVTFYTVGFLINFVRGPKGCPGQAAQGLGIHVPK
jgi:hypothetical protein